MLPSNDLFDEWRNLEIDYDSFASPRLGGETIKKVERLSSRIAGIVNTRFQPA